MSMHHLGEEAPFDPMAALADHGLTPPAEIKPEDVMGNIGALEFRSDGVRLNGQPIGINPKDALGMLKPDLSVVPPAAMLHLASAMMDGAAKYGAFNWRENAVLSRVYVAAAQRHLLQFLDGEDRDPLSKVHHLAHAMACCAIVLDAQETGNLDDNRPTPGAAGDMIRRWTGDDKFGDKA